MTTVQIKPLSVNEAWKGKRYKTEKYKWFEYETLFLLPKNLKLPKAPYFVYFEFGLSNKAADWDNPIKPFQDVLQKKYGFNDKDVESAFIKTQQTPKGNEYIKFEIVGSFDELIQLICDNN